MRPHDTAWWRRQQVRHGEYWQRLMDDPEAVGIVEQIALRVACAYELGDGTEVEKLLDEVSIASEELAIRTAAVVPELAHFYGDAQLSEAVRRFAVGRELRELGVDVKSVLPSIPPLMVQGLPDTAVTFAGEQAMVGLDVPTRDLLELATFQDSYRSAIGKPGRPHGTVKQHEAEGRRAYALSEQGKHWSEIAEALWGTRPDEANDVYYEATRKKVRRRINLGERLAAPN